MSETRRLLAFFRDGEVDAIVGEACAVLETTGVKVENDAALELLGAAGVTPAGGRLRLPERMVRDALASAPDRVCLYDRDGALAVDLGGDRVHFDPGSAAIHVIDPATRRRRPATTRDAVDLVRLVEKLPNYAAHSTAVVPGDVPADIADRYRLYLALRFGRKPVVTGTLRRDGFAPMHAMLAAVRGSEEALAERPLAIFDCCVSPPLKWTDLTCQALIDCAQSGVPAQVIAMPMTGATAPVTLRGTIVQHCAENLSGLVIHQLARPGAPFIFGGASSAFDMRHGTTAMGAVETMMLAAGYAQVGRHLGLPTHGYLCVSDAKTIDYQAGLESGMGALAGALAGVNLISGAGMLDFLLTQSLEKILLDHEACGMALRAARGIDDAAGTAALIAEMAGAGEFLSHAHTRAHWRRELSVASRLVDRASYGDWEKGGAASARARASAEVARLLREPAPSPLSAEVTGALDAIMRREAAGADLPILDAGDTIER